MTYATPYRSGLKRTHLLLFVSLLHTFPQTPVTLGPQVPRTPSLSETPPKYPPSSFAGLYSNVTFSATTSSAITTYKFFIFIFYPQGLASSKVLWYRFPVPSTLQKVSSLKSEIFVCSVSCSIPRAWITA